MDGFIDGLSNGWFIRSEADFGLSISNWYQIILGWLSNI
jgi:hypothetical protein